VGLAALAQSILSAGKREYMWKILLSLALIFLPISSCSKLPGVVDRSLNAPTKTTSPRGVSIRVEKGVKVVDADLVAIDAGLQQAFDEARCAGYTRALLHTDYSVALLASSKDKNGVPEIRVDCAQYCGTEFDKGGYITIAGQMIAAGDPYGNVIALPAHSGAMPDHLSLSAKYEAEHVILAWNDGDKYLATMTHGIGQGHPLLSPCANK